MAVSIPFHALRLGAEHIPDKAFEKIPFAGPRYFKEKEEEVRDRVHDHRDRKHAKKSSRRRNDRPSDSEQSDSYSDSDRDVSPRSSRARRSHRRSERQDRRNDRKERGYDSDNATPYDTSRGFRDAPYFPPPPRVAVDDPQGAARDLGAEEAQASRSYNPSEYRQQQPSSREDYSEDNSQEYQGYAPSGPPPNQISSNWGPPPSDSDRYSSVADRYRPSNQNPYLNAPQGSYEQFNRDASPQTQGRGSPNPAYPAAVMLHPDPYAEPQQQVPYNTYQPQYSDEEDDRDSRDSRDDSRHRRRRSRSDSRHGDKKDDRSRSRVGDVSTKAKDGFEKHKKELGVSALGALAGGIIGNEFGGKKGKMGVLIGAAIGGLGGGLFEKKSEEKRAKQKSERRNSRRQSRSGYDSY